MSANGKQEGRNWRAFWENLGWTDARDEDDLTWRLRQRAEQYARAADDEDAPSDDDERLLAFDLGTEQYALDVMYVRVVRKVSYITPVPGVPAFYRGVVNVRGQIITVMDLRYFYDMAVDTSETPSELVLVEANDLEIGLLADHVSGLMSVARDTITSVEDLRYTRGVTPEQVVLLDVARLFEDNRLIVGSVDE